MRHWHFKQESVKSRIKNLSSGNVRFWGGDDKEEAPSLPARPSYESFIPQRSKDIESQLYDFYKQRVTPEYQAITPDQQKMMLDRIQENLAPEFERQMKAQEQGIFSQGITGTPGASILGKLRQDYMKDLMGKGTDIAIENIGLTESGRQYGTGVLERMRGSLLNQANTEYGGAMDDRNLKYQADYNQYQQDQAEDQGFWSGLGGLVGNVGSSLAYDFLSPTRTAIRGAKGVSNMMGIY